MNIADQAKIKRLIDDTTIAFENCGGVNTDYADFATIALNDFRVLLGAPDLTDRELKQLIRRAYTKRNKWNPNMSWASFVARSIAKQANSNNIRSA